MLSVASVLIFYIALSVRTRGQDFDFDFTQGFFNYTYGPWPSWKTEPLLESAIIEVTKGRHDSPAVSPGHYIFSLATFNLEGKSWGPQIFDNDLNLVYMAPDGSQGGFQDPHICDYKGEKGNHICTALLIGEMSRGRGETEKLVYNSSYIQVGKFGSANGLSYPNFHEYNMLEGGESFLQVVYEPRQMDLEQYAGPKNGSVYDACFQEISVRTGESIFQWCYLDHNEVWETYIFPTENSVNLTSDAAGKGLPEDPWDYLHIDAVGKNSEGDYIITARHLDQVLKIAGKNNLHGVDPGTVLWRFGGKHSDFKFNKDTAFSRPHDARFIETSSTETIISLFDNSWEGNNKPSHNTSAGRIIEINNSTKETRLVVEYAHPRQLLSRAAGGMQIMPNSNNAFVAWGWIPEITEFNKNGDVLFHASLSHAKPIFNYRAYKAHWVGRPLWPPKIIAYSKSCKRSKESPLMAYVSWNGATEVKQYRFRIRAAHGPWVSAGTFEKQGFETEVSLVKGTVLRHMPFVRYVSVEALDSLGTVLGSAVAETFVPPMAWAYKKCDEKGCFKFPRFNYSTEYNSADVCGNSSVASYLAFLLVLVLIEGLASLYFSIVKTDAKTRSRERGYRAKVRKY